MPQSSPADGCRWRSRTPRRRAGLLLLATIAVALCGCSPATVTAADTDQWPATIDVTMFSFSMATTLPTTLADSEDALWQVLQQDLVTLVNAPSERVYKLGIQVQREADPSPDIVVLDARSALPHNSAGHSKLRTLSLDLLRVSLCFLPPALPAPLEGSGPAATTDSQVLNSNFAALLEQWRAQAAPSSGLSQGNATRFIDWTIPMATQNTTLIMCDAQSPTPFYITCPIYDRLLYWGRTGLIVAIVLGLAALTAVCITVWVWWTRVENRRRRGQMLQVRPELRHIIFGDHNTRFKQHTLDVWQPVWKPRSVAALMAIFGIGLLLPLGIYFVHINHQLVEVTVRYDNLPECDLATATEATCQVLVSIPEDMAAPVYMYYQLHNFYQNHRSYVMSRSDPQLRDGGSPKLSTECAPLRRWGDWDQAATYPFAANESQAISSFTLYPCGLIAQSYFTDRFDRASVTSSAIVNEQPFTGPGPASFELRGRNWENKDISWSSDRDDRFKARALRPGETDLNPRGVPHAPNRPALSAEAALAAMRNPSLDDESLIVWMRVAPFSIFSKLSHKVLDRDLRAGELLNITVAPSFEVASFGGEKAIVLATANRLGTKNTFFGVAYLVFACLYAVTGAALWLLHRNEPEPLSPQQALQLALAETGEIGPPAARASIKAALTLQA